MAPVAWVLLLLAACQGHAAGREAPKEGNQDKLAVYAAASLRDVFVQLGAEFRRSRPHTTVAFNFAGSQELRTQIEHGAPADLFASADERNMKALADTGFVQGPAVFAHNTLVVIVAKEKAAAIQSLAQLPLAERLVFGALQVPIGMYTQHVIERAARRWGDDFTTKVESRVVSRELNVRQVLAKVALGEADAGIVYRTDVFGKREGVSVVSIEPDLNVVANYPIAVVKGAAHPKLGRDWIAFVLSKRGRQILASAGFASPDDEVAP